MNTDQIFGIAANPAADSECTAIAGSLRITVLTEMLIRVESGSFTDSATQTVINRHFPHVEFKIREDGDTVLISTRKAALKLNKSSGKLIYAKTRDCGTVTSVKGDLKGTYRTLDMSAGAVPLGDGILSKSGVAVLDDSKTLITDSDGSISSRSSCTDKYYFCYGRLYRAALKDFYRLTGFEPMLPRFCLGNWWSRYHAYTQSEYLGLMSRFEKEKIPLTVATVDMDWHWVDVVKKFGKQASNKMTKRTDGEVQRFHSTGWTGYSWNTDLFPDYRDFLNKLHEKNLKVTLNLHPAAGVKFYEDAYPEMAKATGIDPETKEHVPFDISDLNFMRAYFNILHHGYEKDGVDFWWIDWQQGTKSKIRGLDPLWGLNHYHYLDNCRDGKRGLILSRYSGPGSHRYPLGFSGDTVMCFSSLAFQPYFTATASNIGYTWWSHDIGGHTMGVHNDELYIRWLQFGVFSPINRLHSTQNPFTGKEPWNHRKETERTAKEWLRLRKRLIPYLYTANYRTHFEGQPLCEPMYYEHPWNENAYRVKNQFLFASQLIVAPITEKADRRTGLAGTEVFLDGKRYTDIFTGDIYSYKGIHKLYRDSESIPVLAREGSVIPLDIDGESNGADNPTALELLIFNGNGSYELYEDDGLSMNFADGCFATRQFTVSETPEGTEFVIMPTKGDLTVSPEKRMFRLSFRNIPAASEIKITGTDVYSVNGDREYLSVDLPDIGAETEIKVDIPSHGTYIPKSANEKLSELLSRLEGSNDLKAVALGKIIKTKKVPAALPEFIKDPVKEIFLCHNKND